jgi:hypothetical protein
MWESLVCTLRHSVRDKRNLYEASGRNRFKTRGYYSFKFRVHKLVQLIRTLNFHQFILFQNDLSAKCHFVAGI